MSQHPLRPALYVVATPIGNLGDITLRALDVLRAVDLVAAEDTRVTRQLLSHFGIDKPLLALHRHNEQHAGARVLEALGAGRSVALTSDAGTPAVSDPGALMIEQARAAGFDAIAIPGPSALTAAWSVSGLPAAGFLFHGFLPTNARERRRVLATLAKSPYALVFYEAPHRVLSAVRDLTAELGGERTVVVTRELTKFYESVHRCRLGELEAWLESDANRQRGEFVLIVSGAAAAPEPQIEAAETVLRVLLEDLAPAQAARIAARLTGVPRATLYDLSLKIRGDR